VTNTVLRDVLIIGTVALGMAYAVINKEKVYDMLGVMPKPAPSESVIGANSSQSPETSMPITLPQGIAVSIPKSKTDGHFWAEARVNTGIVKFLVDTGASSVALTPEDARRAGINLNTLDYNIPIHTAGGQNVAAAVTLKSVSVGPVTIRNVRALVVPEGLSTSLLGMTFLGELQKVEATPYALILRL